MAAPGLQRSGETFRRSGSSGLVWEDRFLAEDGIHDKTKDEKPEDDGANRQMERSSSNGGNRAYRAIKVSPAVDPPSPKVSGCGICGIFSNSSSTPQKSKPRRRFFILVSRVVADQSSARSPQMVGPGEVLLPTSGVFSATTPAILDIFHLSRVRPLRFEAAATPSTWLSTSRACATSNILGTRPRHVSWGGRRRHPTLHTQLVNLLQSMVPPAEFFGEMSSSTDERAVKEDSGVALQLPLLGGGFRFPPRSPASFEDSGFLSKLTFSWTGSLLSLGRSRALNLDDIPELERGSNVEVVFADLRRKIGDAVVDSVVLSKALILSVRKDVAVAAIFALVCTTAQYVGPYLIDGFVQYLGQRRGIGATRGYALISVFFFAKAVECFSQRHWFFRTQVFGMKAHAALVAAIYEKGLSLSLSSRQGSGGEVVNFMSVDAEKVSEFSWYMIDLLLVPFQVGLALIILYRSLRLASLVALAATIFVMAINIPFARLEQGFQEGMMEAKDRRMKATAESLKNMKVLKLHAWEMTFLAKILDLRKDEAGWLKKYVYTDAVVTVVYWAAPVFIAAVTFLACVLMKIPLESGKVLSAIATFGILKDPIYNLPETISLLAQTKISLDRISRYLSLEELNPENVEEISEVGEGENSGIAVDICGGSFSWDSASENLTLEDINLQVSPGSKVAICGTVGSGKSSLISAILGEIPRLSGRVRARGSRAYVAQSPWIQSGTIESNILFGKEMERRSYERIIEACSLGKDLQAFPSGDQTIIGERGINLSGGQKQRLQIARALYRDADLYLLDDPFSALDAHTANHLFKECLLGLLASKTVIFVTHQMEFLSAADVILVMRGGKISQSGKYSDLLLPGTDFMELVDAHSQSLSFLSHVKTGFLPLRTESCGKQGEENLQQWVQEEAEEEERERGRVGFSVYFKYMTALYKGGLVPLILLSQALFQLFQIGGNYWIATSAPVKKGVDQEVNNLTLVEVYVLFSLAGSVFVCARAVLMAIAGSKTSTLLFNQMHRSVFRAPMAFFDSTPTSRILNRASADQSCVDLLLPAHMGMSAFSVIQLLGVVAVMSQVAWQVFIIFVPVTAISIWYQQYYIAAARDLTRLVGVLNAPIIHHFEESISGLATIRCHKQSSRFMIKNLQLINSYLRPKFYSAGAMEWLCFRLDMLAALTFSSSLSFLLSMPSGILDPGVAGLVVTYGLTLNTLLAWTTWNICNLENKIISVERILQYSSLCSEPSLIVEKNRPHLLWPEYGEICIHDLQLRYATNLPLVLKGITCTFPGGSKIGIVGRTGSGKSTLVQALFRIVDPAGGKIAIDSIDIMGIGLHDLRARLGIIPQEPVLFEGTLRSNIDPLSQHSDHQIWEALDRCQLADDVRKSRDRLDSTVVENGENWSLGQRQLVCMARVLLRKSKILILDEATASVDAATDTLIQRMVRQNFSESTVITIAHRVVSILDGDLVLLLDSGLLVEFDSPGKLLEDRSSSFARLVEEYSKFT